MSGRPWSRLIAVSRAAAQGLRRRLLTATRPAAVPMREARPPQRAGQPRATFLRNHAPETCACDFPPVTALRFWPLCAFVVVALGSRRVVHVGMTRRPTDAWVAQQLREATPGEQRPRYLLRDNASKYGQAFTRVAEASGIAVLRTTYRAPRQNATCERFLGSVRRECTDHVLVLGEAICGASSRTTSATSTPRDRTGACSNGSRTAQEAPCLSPRVAGGCARCRCSAGYTTRSGERHEPW